VNTKTALILLAIVAAAYVCVVGGSYWGGSGGSITKEKARLDSLRGLLVDDSRTRLALSDVEASDAPPAPLTDPVVRIPPGTAVKLLVKPSGDQPLRSLRPKPEPGSAVKLTWEPAADQDGDQPPGAEFTLKSDDDRTVMIESPGGTLTLRNLMPSGPPAGVRLVE